MLSKEKQKLLRSLHDKKSRTESGCFLVEWGKNIQELLISIGNPRLNKGNNDGSKFVIQDLFLSEDFAWANAKILQGFDYEFSFIEDLERCSTLVRNHDGIAVVSIPKSGTFSEDSTKWTLVLDTINDPGNLGTILRIADWYGITRIICSENTVDVYNPKVIMASMGSFCRVSVRYTDLTKILTSTKLPVYGAFLDGKNIHTHQFEKPGYLVIGSESHGIGKSIESLISERITIPRIGQAESLNAGVATAIILDNIFRHI